MGKEAYSFERYLNVRVVANPDFSPDGQHLSFLTDITGVAEVWSVPVSQHRAPSSRSAWPEQLTFRGERVQSATYAPHADVLLVTGDIGGNERAQLFLLQADGSQFTPLTSRLDVMHIFGSWSPDGSRIIYSSNERDARYFDVYERVITEETARLVLRHDGTNYALRYGPDGHHVLVSRVLSNTRNQLLLVSVETGETRYLTEEQGEDGRGALYASPFWSADRQGLYLLSNRDRQFLSLAYLDLSTGELTFLRDTSWDIEQLAVTEDGTKLAIATNQDGYSKIEIFDVSQGWTLKEVLQVPGLPSGVLGELVWSHDGSRLAFTFTAADDTPDIYIWDCQTLVVSRATHSARGGLPDSAFVAPTLIHYPTFDQRNIPAFLYLPEVQQKDLPVVIYVHGGPESQSRPAFNPVVQYLVGNGYAVLVPNVRGSTGYGYEYQSLDDVRLRMDSVADLQHAVFWLRDSGIADASRIAVMGGSYGGFMVLSAITTYPDLWAAAVDIVGIANFVTFLENTGPWRRTLREAEYGSLEHDREFLEKISPIHSAARITCPLFVVHGANDPRVPIGEAEQVVEALRTKNVPVKYLRFEDEGHGLVKRANKLIAYPAIAAFLDRYLKTKA